MKIAELFSPTCRPDLLNPGTEPKSSLQLIDDSVLVTDTAGLYADHANMAMTVGELRKKLAEGDKDFCLHEHQRRAVNQALSQALSLIQVSYYYVLCFFICLL